MPHDDPTPDLTPEEEQVRRLLADARHTEPMPDDVAGRLDGVLADLRDDPDVHVEAPFRIQPRPAADPAAARRRRNVRTWLVAAAAVVVVGVGVNQLDLSGMSSSDDSDAGGATSAELNEDNDGDGPSSTSRARQAPVRLDSDRFGAQVAALQGNRLRSYPTLRGTGAEAMPPTPSGEVEMDRDLVDGDGALSYSVLCHTGRLGAGRLVPVRYDGEAGWLVFRKPDGDTQVVDLFLCGRDEPTRSITLPAR